MKKLLILMLFFPIIVIGQTQPHWLQVQGKPVFDVRQFGAKGVGSGDDAPAIQLAVDAAAEVGGVVYFPATDNSYVISSPISMPWNVSASGDGRGSLIYAVATDAFYMVPKESPVPRNNSFIRDLRIVGVNAATSSTGIKFLGSDETSAASGGPLSMGVTVENVVISAFQTGVYLKNTWRTKIVRCDITAVNAIQLIGQNVMTRIRDNCLDRLSGGVASVLTHAYAIYQNQFAYSTDGVRTTEDLIVANNEVTSFDRGIRTGIILSTVIDSNVFDFMRGTIITTESPNGGFRITNNWLMIAANQTGDGIHIPDISSEQGLIVVENNNIKSADTVTTPPDNGVYISGSKHKNHSIRNNNITGFVTPVKVIRAMNVSLENNILRAYSPATESAITTDTATRIRITNNTVEGAIKLQNSANSFVDGNVSTGTVTPFLLVRTTLSPRSQNSIVLGDNSSGDFATSARGQVVIPSGDTSVVATFTKPIGGHGATGYNKISPYLQYAVGRNIVTGASIAITATLATNSITLTRSGTADDCIVAYGVGSFVDINP